MVDRNLAGNRSVVKRLFSSAVFALAAAMAPALAADETVNAGETVVSEKFITLADGFLVTGQIEPGDIAAAKALGVTLIVNNRPDGEAPGQPKGEDIARAARAAGLAYVAIPVGAAGVGEAQLDAFDAALAGHSGAVLAFCRTGTRSTTVWALAQARAGAPAAEIIRQAAAAGYNLSGLAPRLEALSQTAGE